MGDSLLPYGKSTPQKRKIVMLAGGIPISKLFKLYKSISHPKYPRMKTVSHSLLTSLLPTFIPSTYNRCVDQSHHCSSNFNYENDQDKGEELEEREKSDCTGSLWNKQKYDDHKCSLQFFVTIPRQNLN